MAAQVRSSISSSTKGTTPHQTKKSTALCTSKTTDAAKGSPSNAHTIPQEKQHENNIQFCAPLSCSLHTNYQCGKRFGMCVVRSVHASSVRDAIPIMRPQNKPFPQNNIKEILGQMRHFFVRWLVMWFCTIIFLEKAFLTRN
jgi:hypothetical protein